MPLSDRDAAAELARRINVSRTDASKEDEAARPPEDRPPGYANLLMSESPASIERALHLDSADWQLIGRALEHYARCGSE